MFQSQSESSKPREKQFLLAWMEGILASGASVKAHEVFERISGEVPALAKLRMTPQSPPHHAEGAHVAAHVERMLAVVFAMADDGAQLLDIEEIAREKDLTLEFKTLEETIRSHKDFFVAYALAHDLGKAETLRFDALEDKKGSAEGFVSKKDRLTSLATEPEKQRYDKLFRAFPPPYQGGGQGAVAAFFDAYGVGVHYDGHDRKGASGEFAAEREAILRTSGVSVGHAKMLTELIRAHMDVLKTFERGPDVPAFSAFGAIAMRAGLNKELFLDFTSAALLLDGVLGSLHYAHGKFGHNVAPVINFYRAERAAEPNRHAFREEIEHRNVKNAVKELLYHGGLDPDSVFELLKTPIGPVRGKVMHVIYDLIRDPESPLDLGEHTAEIRARALKTQALFRERGIPFTL